MSEQIEAWVQRANDIATHIAELQARVVMYNTETLHNAWKKQKDALDAHLRTTPEGYRLVPVEPTTCPIEDDIKHYEADDFDFSDMARVVRVSLRYAKTMPSGHDRCLLYTLAKYVERQLIAASQESANAA